MGRGLGPGTLRARGSAEALAGLLERLEPLAGREKDQVAAERELEGTRWCVMADPEGNEFCIALDA